MKAFLAGASSNRSVVI